MMPGRGRRRGEHRRLVRLVEDSPLRRVDPRVKLEIGILSALAVMLPLDRLAIFWVAFALAMIPAKLAGEMWRQIRRIAWILAMLFILDWLVVGLEFSVLITLRFTLVVSAFVVFFSTTRPEEFRLAMERLGLRQVREWLGDLIALSVPAIVLTVKRAWTFTEAAYARGFDSPRRRPYLQLTMRPLDWALSVGSLVVIAVMFISRQF